MMLALRNLLLFFRRLRWDEEMMSQIIKTNNNFLFYLIFYCHLIKKFYSKCFDLLQVFWRELLVLFLSVVFV